MFMKLIKVGDLAPDFSLQDNNDKIIRLLDFRGKKVLLSWHPLAWTPVCTDQMRALETNWDFFEKLNTVPLGLSIDSQPCKKVWATALVLKNLRILADFCPNGRVTKDYGIYIEDKSICERANNIVDENGIMKWIKVYHPISQLPDLNEVIQILSKI